MTLVPYPDFPGSLQDQLQRVVDCSPFAAGLIERYPEGFKTLVDSGRLEDGGSDGGLPEAGATDFDARLRAYRNLAMLQIIWRDLNDIADLEATLAELTNLAEACIQAAIDHHSVLLEKRHGDPGGQQLIVIAMGKLGGRELNMSSDVDLVFVYPREGETSGQRRLSLSEYFTRLTRAVIASLSEQSEHGFVFRVDTRLRPYGSAGPLLVSEAAIEQYYQREGREWERYALLKARAVAGDINAGTLLLDRLRPFVYRRYVDFGAFEALREMAQKISEEATRRGWQEDIKRGPGGIREAEFFIQSFQLLRGGKENSLQTTSFFEAANAVAELALVDSGVIEQIIAGYCYLRTAENRLQALHDQQTHHLPESASDRQALATAMQLPDWQAFCASLGYHRTVIRQIFDTLARPESDALQNDRGDELWSVLSAENEDLLPLAGSLCSEPSAAIDQLLSFRRFLARTALSQRAQQRLERLMPQLLGKLAENPLAANPLNHVLDLVRAISRRSAYLVLLSENPLVMDRLLGLFTKSSWIAEQVIRYPLLLDELIDPSLSADLPGKKALGEVLAQTVKTNQDDGQQLAALNEFKLGILLRIAIAELEQHIDVQTAQQLLSDLAEVLIERVFNIAATALADRFGNVAGIELGIIAYGTLGARELGYHSDLDLVFLYREPDLAADKAGSEQYAVRLSQRILTYLASRTLSGALYLVDTRLRPNGSSGSLVSSLNAFEKYQLGQSWTWEQQALTRARWIAGSKAVSPAFSAIRSLVCGRERQADTLQAEIFSMRERVRADKLKAGKQGMDFKHGTGGMLDIEFIAQFGVLLHAADKPSLLETTGTLGQITHLLEAGFLDAQEVAVLENAWLAYSRARHFSALTHFRDTENLEQHMSCVNALWGRLFNADQGTTKS